MDIINETLKPPFLSAAVLSPSNQSMPAIPSAVLERIRRGEFVNFDLLLPNNVPSETANSFTMSFENTESSSAPRIIVQNSNSNKNKVFDLHSWLLTWSLFLQVMIIFMDILLLTN